MEKNIKKSKKPKIDMDEKRKSILEKAKKVNEIETKTKKNNKVTDLELAKNKRKRKNETPKKPKRKLNNSFRINRDQPLNLDNLNYSDTNDVMVKLIKEKINELGNFTMNDVYDKLASNDAYNLFYGLATRDSMNWKTFETWCDILDLEPEVIVRNKE